MNESTNSKAFHVVYTEDDIKADIEKLAHENTRQFNQLLEKMDQLEKSMGLLSKEWIHTHKELAQVQRELHEWLSFVSTKQQLDARQQNLNLRQSVPFRFVPQKSSTGSSSFLHIAHATPNSSMHHHHSASSSSSSTGQSQSSHTFPVSTSITSASSSSSSTVQIINSTSNVNSSATLD